MAVKYIDYEVLAQGKTDYANQAAEILDIVKKIRNMNANLMQGWSNETARAFVDRIDHDHIPKLEQASTAIAEVSKYISDYISNQQEEDSQGASAISG